MDEVDPRASPPPKAWGVTVDANAVERLAESWAGREFALPRWDYPGLPSYPWPAAWVDFCGVACSVMACLWPAEGDEAWSVEFRDGRLVDAPALFHCFDRGLRASPAGLDLRVLEGWSDADAEAFFRGRGRLQLVPERRRRLSGLVAALSEAWDGRFLHLLEDAGGDGPAIVERLVGTLPGFRDEAETEAGRVAFHKRARLAAAMMGGREAPAIARLDTFPVYADYMLPRVLRHQGVLVYDAGLAADVDRRRSIPAGSSREVAIRWATVYAAERLRAALTARGSAVTTPALDYRLWHDAVLGPRAAEMGEHHRTVTLAY